VDISDVLLARFLLLLATIRLKSVAVFANLDSLFANLSGLLAFPAVIFVSERMLLAELLSLSGNDLKVFQIFLALLFFKRAGREVISADFLDKFFVRVADLIFIFVVAVGLV
jgi:hypothetical protein